VVAVDAHDVAAVARGIAGAAELGAMENNNAPEAQVGAASSPV